MKRTTLWHVGIVQRDNNLVVAVSKDQQPFYWCGSHMRIRTISPHAAGRKFIRGNIKNIVERYIEKEASFGTTFAGVMHARPEYVPIITL